MTEFNYYYRGVRHTETDREYLENLISGENDNEEVIEGILQSKADFDAQHNPEQSASQ